jgi:hypothetical protein
VTWEGQIVCVCYATIGIPLFLMCIANISGVLGDMFRYVYARVCCRLCLKKKKKEPTDPTTKASGNKLDDEGREIEQDERQKNDPEWENKLDETTNENRPKVIDDDDLGEEGDANGDERITVPLTITMIIITCYILIGAVLFNQFEGWTLIQSGYFCYITLATIGFGDFVPGQKSGDPYAGAKLILGAIYVLFGMAILAMCFDLMQEEIIAKFTWLGKKLGIIDKDEDDLQEEEEDENSSKKKAAAAGDDDAKANYDNVDDYKNKKDFKSRKEPFMTDTSNIYSSPTPSYKTATAHDDENMSRLRSSYLQSIRQNK